MEKSRERSFFLPACLTVEIVISRLGRCKYLKSQRCQLHAIRARSCGARDQCRAGEIADMMTRQESWNVEGVTLTLLRHISVIGYTVSVFRFPSSLLGREMPSTQRSRNYKSGVSFE